MQHCRLWQTINRPHGRNNNCNKFAPGSFTLSVPWPPDASDRFPRRLVATVRIFTGESTHEWGMHAPAPCHAHAPTACSNSYRLVACVVTAEVLEADGRPEVEEVEARALHEDHGVMVHGAGYALEGGFDMAGGQTESLLGVPGSTTGAGALLLYSRVSSLFNAQLYAAVGCRANGVLVVRQNLKEPRLLGSSRLPHPFPRRKRAC
jgi:hypothetical protein